MLGSLIPIALVGLLQATGAFADDDAVSCGLDNKCPEEMPCCSRESYTFTSRTPLNAELPLLTAS